MLQLHRAQKPVGLSLSFLSETIPLYNLYAAPFVSLDAHEGWGALQCLELKFLTRIWSPEGLTDDFPASGSFSQLPGNLGWASCLNSLSFFAFSVSHHSSVEFQCSLLVLWLSTCYFGPSLWKGLILAASGQLSCLCLSQWFLTKVPRYFNGGMNSLINKWHNQKVNIEPYFHPTEKINSKCIMDLNVSVKIKKFLEDIQEKSSEPWARQRYLRLDTCSHTNKRYRNNRYIELYQI